MFYQIEHRFRARLVKGRPKQCDVGNWIRQHPIAHRMLPLENALEPQRNRAAMTPEQIDLVRRSFDAIWPVRRALAQGFYSKLFELAPDARRLFPNDMERQQLKLMDMVAAIVGALDQRDLFQSLIAYTGRQHAHFRVQPAHYAAFGEALMWSLEQQFGAAFTPQLKEAWLTLYSTVQDKMMHCAV